MILSNGETTETFRLSSQFANKNTYKTYLRYQVTKRRKKKDATKKGTGKNQTVFFLSTLVDET